MLLDQFRCDNVEILLDLLFLLFVDLRVSIGHDHSFEVAAALDIGIGVPLGESHQQVLKGVELEAQLAVLERSLDLSIFISAIPCQA